MEKTADDLLIQLGVKKSKTEEEDQSPPPILEFDFQFKTHRLPSTAIEDTRRRKYNEKFFGSHQEMSLEILRRLEIVAF